ncbi:UDP-N-acetylmuramate--L-alanine ligase [Thermodesulforhabdus norvegica]|uniref:UDP-N-acetylmuramate--L-alanine ligase n=1 Tax=Thermodesulforhabdus norvegica TaxID=39841 RepID=A0A1I4SMH2_9BACT|nr:Mur ligase family protein [Thermodesulforhabdus norvegica]SFM65619.1 UDP-N-acetylmuramate--L-alanine ligase [Thermodesulforhabdus norvegica]
MTIKSRPIYLLGIGGIAMGNLAGFLQEKGYPVAGSDRSLYSPMKEFLTARNIPVRMPYAEANVSAIRPDLAVIGNAIRADNPEARWIVQSGTSYMSMPEAINHFMLNNHKSLVVAGTHGKSTTAALLLWVLHQAGMDPSGFVGAIIKKEGKGYMHGSGPFAVIEGDEYDTAFFDKRPKFLHYNPFGAIVTGIEFDHADIYKDVYAIRKAFESFVRLIPPEGVLVLRNEDPHADTLRKICRGKVVTYGLSEKADWRILSWDADGRMSFMALCHGHGKHYSFPLSLIGKHNALNALAVVALLDALGIDLNRAIPGFATYPGLKRRQEILVFQEDLILVDDFAHHPTAVTETIKALKAHFPERRLIAIFEPRTNTSKRAYFQDAYAEAFDGSEIVILKAPPDYNELPEKDRLNLPELAARLKDLRIDAHWALSSDEVVSICLRYLQKGDLVLCMSNGDMDGVPEKLSRSFRSRAG